MIWRHHGLVTWGETAREAYEATIRIVTAIEELLSRRFPAPAARKAAGSPAGGSPPALEEALPLLRGALARPSGDPDRPHRRVILRAVTDPGLLEPFRGKGGREAALTPPLTSDHVVRVGMAPCWVEGGAADPEGLKARLLAERDRYQSRFPELSPSVFFVPGAGALCAGKDALQADVAADLTAQALRVKGRALGVAGWEPLAEEHLLRMATHRFQRRKAGAEKAPLPLEGEVALVTGAAGAIGSGICEALLAAGACVAATDLAGEALDRFTGDLLSRHPARVFGLPMDVTDPASVRDAVGAVVRRWGGVDLGIINAGIAHVSPLAGMDIERFRQLERVNVDGTLLVIRELARVFSLQGTGGDLVLVSTKNVFAPGAGFGAYSATKAAAHQLARIASLELAGQDVRVNMVAPDAVFSHGERRSGLWAEVGPDRMKARGLDEKGLEEYYRGRNLLKAKVTAEHVARAVLFFATRQTPTTGATLPVDGGLPDATPR